MSLRSHNYFPLSPVKSDLSTSKRKHQTRVSRSLALTSSAYPHYDRGLIPSHSACDCLRVATSMPYTRLVGTTARDSEIVIRRERPSKLPNPFDEVSETQADLTNQ